MNKCKKTRKLHLVNTKRTTLKAERDQVYSGYFIESYQGGIEGKYGENTAVRVTSPTGEKQTTDLKNNFTQFVSAWKRKALIFL